MLHTLADCDVIPYLREVCGLPWSQQEIIDQIIQRMETFYSSQVRPKPGLEKFLSILKMEGVWMYVATATHRRLTEKALKTAGIDHYFRGIVTSADAGNHKSESADIYEMAMRRLQSNKRDTVVFEDALHAIRTAKAAGFRVAGVYEATAEQDQPEIQRLCDYYIRSYEEHDEGHSTGLGLLGGDASGAQAEEAAFERDLKRRKKKRRKGLGL